jgi:hypothetical protein
VDAPSEPDATDRSAIRRTAVPRNEVMPTLIEGPLDGYLPTDPYVRMFWIPILGPGAVADLCRLTAAATRGRPLKMPIHIDLLARTGHVHHGPDGSFGVVTPVRPLSAREARRLPPRLRRAHRVHTARSGRPLVQRPM